jgi:hypothetical protein
VHLSSYSRFVWDLSTRMKATPSRRDLMLEVQVQQYIALGRIREVETLCELEDEEWSG